MWLCYGLSRPPVCQRCSSTLPEQRHVRRLTAMTGAHPIVLPAAQAGQVGGAIQVGHAPLSWQHAQVLQATVAARLGRGLLHQLLGPSLQLLRARPEHSHTPGHSSDSVQTRDATLCLHVTIMYHISCSPLLYQQRLALLNIVCHCWAGARTAQQPCSPAALQQACAGSAIPGPKMVGHVLAW